MSNAKKCAICKVSKAVDSFLSKDGKRHVKTCIACRERTRAWSEANPERCLASRRRNAEKICARSRRWYADNKERAKCAVKARIARIGTEARRKEQQGYQAKWLSNPKNKAKRQAAVSSWISSNRPKMNEAYRRWYIRNQDALRLAAHERAEVYGKSDFRLEDWEEILIEFNHCCGYCLRGDAKLTMDHMTPISRGGKHEASNIIPACKSCNSSKSDRSMLLMARKSTGRTPKESLIHGI